MKFALERSFSILPRNAYNILGSTNKFNLKILLNNYLASKSQFSTIPEGQKSTVNTVKIPHWIDGDLPAVKTEEIVGTNVDNQLKVLKRIRPFRLNQLSVFNPNPYSLSKPIKKNPVLKHLWKLRVNTVYRRDSSKRIVVNANIVKHILTHTDTSFDVILTTRKDLIDFVFSNPDYSSRFSRIQLVDKYTLQYCLRGTTQSYNLVDTVAEAYIPSENKEISPRFVLAFDNIKYTQNLGSLIRTSIALGVDLLYYIKGTTDPFNWKVSSITGGVQYSIPHRFGEHKDLRKFCKQKNLVPIVAHLEGEPLDTLKVSGKGVCLILGNESEGPHPDIFKFAKRVSLYMHPFANSLNVSIAGSIIIHQLKSRLETQQLID